IEYSYPLLNEPIDEYWSNIGILALPDGVHQRQHDLIYFHLPSIDHQDHNKKKHYLPAYGNVSEELKLLTEKYFEEKNFNERKMFEEFFDKLNKNPPKFNLKYYFARDLVYRYRHLIETGLNECTLIDEKSDIENEINLNESEGIVFSRNDNKQIDFDNIKLKTLKIVGEDIKNKLLKRATSITNKLSDTLNHLTSTTSTSTSITINNSEIFHLIDQYEFNRLFRQQNNIDFILTDYDDDFIIQSPLLKQQLQLTTADLRFIQLFEDSQSNDEAINGFNPLFVKSFQSTNTFRLWQSKGPYPYIDQIPPRVNDVKLRVAQYVFNEFGFLKNKTKLFCSVLDDSEAATKVLGQAKNSLFSSVIGTINQGNQWLSKGQSSSSTSD
ncbi:unnamed protein product, partial [Rotaria sp. Silwood1]